ncbi:MAG: glutaminase [Bacteroidaceae bacterium]|nr:glutaminase [Bacteroidaceae bacterium]
MEITKQEIIEIAASAYEYCRKIKDGTNAAHIPYYAKESSELFGLSICFADGESINIGDSKYIFALDSISTIATALLILKQYGSETMHKMIGCSGYTLPSDIATPILLEKDYPSTPLMLPGALAAVSMVNTVGNIGQKWKAICDNVNTLCGSRTKFIEELYKAQSSQNAETKATAWMLKRYNRIYDDPELAIELYTKQCSIGVTTEQLATFAATIANNGINPIKGERIFERRHAPKIVSLMATGGLSDYNDEWLFASGIPAKTGVSGGIMGVLPGMLGIAAFAPPLDSNRCSVRAQAAIKFIMEKSGLNVFCDTGIALEKSEFSELLVVKETI